MEETKEAGVGMPTPNENTPAVPTGAGRRRRSLVAFNANPLAAETKSDNDAVSATAAAPPAGHQKFRASIMSDALPVALVSDLDLLVADLLSAGSNEERLQMVDDSKQGKMFSCAQLKQIIDTTPSIKTKIGMVERIAPQITDPKAGTEIVSQFRFTEDKRRVEEAFKNRDFELNAQRMSGPKGRNIVLRGRGRGAGRGAGRGGRGGSTRHSTTADAMPSAQEIGAGLPESRRGSV